jgi:putative oligomerization/nucleic acid binding protein
MRGRWAAVAVGSSVAKNKAKAAAAQQQAAAAQQQAAAAQQQAAAAQQQPNTTSQQTGEEDVTQKLQKLANLKQQGLISEEEYQKMKSDLLAKL